MINKQLLDRFKIYKFNGINNDYIIESFPPLFANLLTMMQYRFPTGHGISFRFEKKVYDTFVSDLRFAIINKKYDDFDNIILSLLHNYNFRYKEYLITLDFCELEMENFINICNSFKGKTWNMFLDTFIDAFYQLLCTAKANGTEIYL
jgi:hypothetical protein